MPTAPTQSEPVTDAAVAALAGAATAPLNTDGEVVVNDNNTQPPAVSQPTATTPKEDKSFDFGDDGPKLISEPLKVAAKPKTEEEVTDEPEEVTAEPKTGDQQQQQPASTVQPPARDYSVFPEEMRDVMRKAPNAIYDAVKAQVERAKQIENEAAELRKGALPQSYYEHPLAYQFDRGYQSAVQTYQQAEFERSHWTKQIAALRSGKETINTLDGFDGRTGEPIYREIKVAPEQAGDIEASILNNLATIASVANQSQQQANYVKQSFANNHGAVIQYLRGAEDKFFPDLKDIAKHPRKADYDYFVEKFLPQPMRNNPLASGLGKAYVAILNRDAKIAELTKEIEAIKRGKVADTLAGPSATAMTGAATTAKPVAKPGQGELSMAVFNKLTSDD